MQYHYKSTHATPNDVTLHLLNAFIQLLHDDTGLHALLMNSLQRKKNAYLYAWKFSSVRYIPIDARQFDFVRAPMPNHWNIILNARQSHVWQKAKSCVAFSSCFRGIRSVHCVLIKINPFICRIPVCLASRCSLFSLEYSRGTWSVYTSAQILDNPKTTAE